MKTIIYAVGLFFLGFCKTTCAMDKDLENIDSIVEQLSKKEYLLNYEKQEPLLKKLRIAIRQTKDKRKLLSGYYTLLANIVMKKGDYTDFNPIYNEVKRLSIDLQEKSIFAKASIMAAYFHSLKGNITKEIELYKKIIEYTRDNFLTNDYVGAVNNLANKYRDLHLHKKAIEYYKLSIKVKLNDLSLRNIAHIYLSIGDIENAEKYASRLNTSDKNNSSFNYMTLASIEIKKNNFEKAKNYILKAKRELNGLDHNLTFSVEGDYFYSKGNYDQAIIFYEELLKSKILISDNKLLETKRKLAKSYRMTGDYESSSKYFDIYQEESKKISEKRAANSSAVLLAELQYDHSEMERKSLEKELMISKKEIDFNRKARFLESSIAFLLLMITVLLYIHIKKQKAKNLKLEALANTDDLTQVMNRRSILNELDKCINTSNSIFTVAILDIDNFKSINDTHGHQVGDEILVSFAQLARTFLRKSDLIGRYGGEEFFVIFKDTDLMNAQSTMNRFLNEIQDFTFPSVKKVTFSAGISEYNNHESHEIINCADKKLYMAKNNGRNQIIA